MHSLLDLRIHQPHIDKIYLYAKDSYRKIYHLLFKKGEIVGGKYCNDPEVLIEYLNGMGNVYKNIHVYNQGKRQKY